ncbi:hypothetical protein BC832DRAFT_594439 [Gaertneriomyces semiglobifer]|nr:hypothetical protein BC832DRAFT_594439 [Gaertneriomyces semiglobifer]
MSDGLSMPVRSALHVLSASSPTPGATDDAFYGWRETRPVLDSSDDGHSHPSPTPVSAECGCQTEDDARVINHFVRVDEIRIQGHRCSLYRTIHDHISVEVLYGLLQFHIEVHGSENDGDALTFHGTLTAILQGRPVMLAKAFQFSRQANPRRYAMQSVDVVRRVIESWLDAHDVYQQGGGTLHNQNRAKLSRPVSTPTNAGVTPSSQDQVTVMISVFERLLSRLDSMAPQRQAQPQGPAVDRSLPKFDGTRFNSSSSKVISWVQAFDSPAAASGVQDKDRFCWLARALDIEDTSVWSWYNGYTGDKQDWPSVRSNFMLTFATATDLDPAIISHRLSTIQRRPEQSIRQYSADFRALQEELNYVNSSIATVPVVLTTPQLQRAYMSGLNCEAISNHITGLDHTARMSIQDLIKECVSFAEKRAAYQPSLGLGAIVPSKPAPPAPEGTRRNYTYSAPRPPANPRPTPRKAPDSTQPVDQLTDRMKNLRLQAGTDASTYRPPLPPSNPQYRERRRVGCYRCGSDQHYQRDCTAAPNQVTSTWHGHMLSVHVDSPHEYDPEYDEYYLNLLDTITDLPTETDFPEGARP